MEIIAFNLPKRFCFVNNSLIVNFQILNTIGQKELSDFLLFVREGKHSVSTNLTCWFKRYSNLLMNEFLLSVLRQSGMILTFFCQFQNVGYQFFIPQPDTFKFEQQSTSVPMVHANRSSSTDVRGLKNDFCLVIQFDYKNIQAIKIFVKHSTKLCCATCCWLPTLFKGDITQVTFTCSKSTIETLVNGVECLKLIINASERRQ